MKKVLFAIALVAGFSVAQAADDNERMSREQIAKIIKPVGEVTVGGGEAAAKPAGPRSGETVYKSSCFACHGTGANGAPKKNNAGDWGPRVAKGIDVLLNHAIHGFNAMPPKGTCMDCTDDELKAAIEFMSKS